MGREARRATIGTVGRLNVKEPSPVAPSLPRGGREGRGEEGAIAGLRRHRAGHGRSRTRNILVAACLVFALVLGSAGTLRAQSDDALPALVQLLSTVEDPQFQLDLLKGLSAGLKGRRNVGMPEGWEAVEAKLSRSENPEVRALTQSLSLTFGSAGALIDLRRQLMDREAPLELRRRALDSLLAAKDPELAGALRELLSDPALRGAALRALAAYDDERTPAAILKIYPTLGVAEKRDALNTLVSRSSFARQLLAGVENETVPARDLTADIVRQLRTYRDDAINRQVEALWGVARESSADKQKEVARYKAMIQKGPDGDAFHGRAVFARTCQQCHALFGVGGGVGPDITGSNRGDLDYILHNILDPNAEIPNDYRTSILSTTDERVVSGIVKRQDANAVTMVTANDTVTVPRAEIESLYQSELSMMPEGLVEALSETEVRDLIAYLKSPSQVPMRATPENADQFFNGRDLAGWEGDLGLWSVENGEIVGRTDGLPGNEWLSGPLLLGDFRFVCQVKLVDNAGNSGIQFRSERLENGEVQGYQADIGAGWWGKLYEEHGRGLLWDESGEAYVRKGDWNTYEIVAVGDKIRTALNGHRCVDLVDPKGARRGIMAFQLHSGGATEVRFKDLSVEVEPEFVLKTVVPKP